MDVCSIAEPPCGQVRTPVRLSGMRVEGAEATRLMREPAVRSVAAVRAEVVLPEPENTSSDRIRAESTSHESWAPYLGYSDVNQSYIQQTFYFNKVSDFDSRSTYECETQIYDPNFANWGGYWSSNMPRAYLDTRFGDRPDIDNFTIGSAQASSFNTSTAYFAYMTLKAQTSKTAQVRVKGQKGHRTPSWCYSTWCIFADATTGSLVNYIVPSGKLWRY